MTSEAKRLKTIAFAMPTGRLTALGKELKANGYDVNRDNDAGTFTAKADGDETVVWALQTGVGKTWIVRADPRVITVEFND